MNWFRVKWLALGYRLGLKDARDAVDSVGTVAHANFLLAAARGLSEARDYQGQADACSEILEFIESLERVGEVRGWRGILDRAKNRR